MQWYCEIHGRSERDAAYTDMEGYFMTAPQILKNGAWTRTTPEQSGWEYVSFEVRTLQPGEEISFGGDGDERAFVPLRGKFSASAGDAKYEFGGRASVFEGLGSCLYIPRDTAVSVQAPAGGEIAIASAPATEQHEIVLVTPDDVPIDVRGAGNATRQIGNLMPPSFPADRLHIVEVWTPGGNWSSYPPHKHEHDTDNEAQLEETYYYRLRDPENGWAIQRVYSPERNFELTEPVRDGDICLIPWGFHTTAAAHGHDLYYLNVLAGPAPKRTLQALEDPCLAPLRERWQELDTDSRVPFIPRYPAS
jgi:5-deoxy-glucuronate isomerase